MTWQRGSGLGKVKILTSFSSYIRIGLKRWLGEWASECNKIAAWSQTPCRCYFTTSYILFKPEYDVQIAMNIKCITQTVYGCERCDLCWIGSYGNWKITFPSLSPRNSPGMTKWKSKRLLFPLSYVQKEVQSMTSTLRSPLQGRGFCPILFRRLILTQPTHKGSLSPPRIVFRLHAYKRRFAIQISHKPTGEPKPHATWAVFLRNRKSNCEIQIVILHFA